MSAFISDRGLGEIVYVCASNMAEALYETPFELMNDVEKMRTMCEAATAIEALPNLGLQIAVLPNVSTSLGAVLEMAHMQAWRNRDYTMMRARASAFVLDTFETDGSVSRITVDWRRDP